MKKSILMKVGLMVVFILNKSVKEYINEGNQSFEKEPLSKISNENKLIAYKHEGLFDR